MLQATDIACVRGTRELFRNLSFAVGPGCALRVQGENGAGKTSLLRILAGLAFPAAGSVQWNEKPVRQLGEQYLRDLAFIGHANALKDDLTPIENLRNSLAVSGLEAFDPALRGALAADGLDRVADLPVQWLSQGQKRRVALSRLAFCEGRRLWVLDEPFSALDTVSVARVCGCIERHLTNGGTVVYTTHQDVVLAVPTQLLTLE